MKKKLVLILGNQLFPISYYKKLKISDLIMIESYDLCTYVKHHKLKIILFLSSMRSYRDQMRENSFNLDYYELTTSKKNNFINLLGKALKGKDELVGYEVEDKLLELKIKDLCRDLGIKWTILPSPMFICRREYFKSYLESVKKPFMKNFYERQRKKFNVLIDNHGVPFGGKWSFDNENRNKIPNKLVVDDVEFIKDVNPHLPEVKKLVLKLFGNHPGSSSSELVFPTTRKAYLQLLDNFFKKQLKNFGKYQDAISNKTPFLYHSLISPGLNLGLILPSEVISKVVQFYEKNLDQIPLSSVEGFVRQILGWREFIRGIYQNKSDEFESTNFWRHKNTLASSWYTGDLEIPPIDDCILKAQKYSYNHHIERLMVLSSAMLLCEVNPKIVHDWFMEMYIDSSEWVMGPNVYGMGQFSSGGIFATKPYICGSNYILKMSHYKKGDWCEVIDGLYWRFICKHESFFSKNPRMRMMVSASKRLDPERKKKIFLKAENFISTHCQ